jgi:hypothetical protein
MEKRGKKWMQVRQDREWEDRHGDFFVTVDPKNWK